LPTVQQAGYDRDSDVWAWFTHNNGRTLRSNNPDHARNYDAPGYLIGPALNPLLELPDGSLLGATSAEGNCQWIEPDRPNYNGQWSGSALRSAVLRIAADNLTGTEPQGSPWAVTVFPAEPHRRTGIHGAFLALSKDYGNLMLITRDGIGGLHRFVTSADGGKTWTDDWKRLPDTTKMRTRR